MLLKGLPATFLDLESRTSTFRAEFSAAQVGDNLALLGNQFSFAIRCTLCLGVQIADLGAFGDQIIIFRLLRGQLSIVAGNGRIALVGDFRDALISLAQQPGAFRGLILSKPGELCGNLPRPRSLQLV